MFQTAPPNPLGDVFAAFWLCSALGALLVLVLWICLPFAVFGIKRRLEQINDRLDFIARTLEWQAKRAADADRNAPPLVTGTSTFRAQTTFESELEQR